MLNLRLRSRGDPLGNWRSTNRRRTRKRVRLLLMATTLLATMLPASMAAAEPMGPDEPAGQSPIGPVGATGVDDADESAEALQRMAAQVAVEYGVDVETALARLKHQEAVAPLIAGWRESYSQFFGGAYHAADFSARTTVRWVGQVPAEVRAQVAARAVAIGFDTSAEVSESGLIAKAEQIFSTVSKSDISEFSTSPDILRGQVVVAVAVDEDSAIATEIADAIRKLEAPKIGTSVQWASEDLLNASTAYGGTEAQFPNKSQLACTLAFTVQRGSTKGILSAGHCPNNLDYVDPVDGSESSLTLEAEYEGYYGDYAWYSTSESVVAQFYASSSSSGRRFVTAVKPRNQINIGDTYCFYGRRTNRDSCGTVKYTSTCHRGGAIDVCNQVRVRNVYGRKGDSGGPWYVASTAVGVHTGCFGSGCGDRSTRQDQSFTPVTLAEDGLGVSVLTR